MTVNKTIFDGIRQSQTLYGCFLKMAESGCFRAFGSVWIKIGPYRNVRSLWLRGQDRGQGSRYETVHRTVSPKLRCNLEPPVAGSSPFYHNYKKTDTETVSVFLWLRG